MRFLAHTKVIHRTQRGVSGHNELARMLRVARFDCRRGRSALDHDLEVVRISYDRPENSRLVRPLTDEVRLLPGGDLLGRGVYRFAGGRRRNVFWFSMRREHAP